MSTTSILQSILISSAPPQELEVGAGDHFNNGIRMSKWGTNYAWKKLREKVNKLEDKFYEKEIKMILE